MERLQQARGLANVTEAACHALDTSPTWRVVSQAVARVHYHARSQSGGQFKQQQAKLEAHITPVLSGVVSEVVSQAQDEGPTAVVTLLVTFGQFTFMGQHPAVA